MARRKEKSERAGFFRSRSLRVDIFTALIGLLLVTVIVLVVHSRARNVNAIRDLSMELTHQVAETVIKKTDDHLKPAERLVETSARLAEKGVLPLGDGERLETFLLELPKNYSQISRFFIGDEGGNFLMVKRPPEGTIVTMIVDRAARPPTLTWQHRDREGNVVRTETSTEIDYDPRARPWYRGAKAAGDTFWTPVYIFHNDRKPGITAAHPVYDLEGKLFGVFGADIELGDISDFLRTLRIGKSGFACIVNDRGEIAAYPDEDVSRLAKEEDGQFRPMRVEELGDERLAEAFREHRRTGAKRISFTLGGKRYNAYFTEFPESGWKIGVVAPESDFIGSVLETHKSVFAITIGILIVAILTAALVSRSISRPIEQLAAETEKIRDLRLDGEVDVSSVVKEIQLMSGALASMKTGLQAFRRYVPAELVRKLIRTGEEARIGGRSREITVFFSDIYRFTALSEGMEPEALMAHLSEYLESLTRIILEEKGTVDKYIGDAIMAFWGAPVPDEEHAFHACRAALRCMRKVEALDRKWAAEGKLTLPTRIGVHTGETVVGNVGSSERMNYSAIGDTVNLASRLEGINKVYGTGIIVSQTTYERVADRFLFRPLDVTTIRGKKREIMIYELLGERGDDLHPETSELRETFTLGFRAYQRHDREEALKIFQELIERFPGDKPTRIYVDRLRKGYEDAENGEFRGTAKERI